MYLTTSSVEDIAVFRTLIFSFIPTSLLLTLLECFSNLYKHCFCYSCCSEDFCCISSPMLTVFQTSTVLFMLVLGRSQDVALSKRSIC